MRILFPFTITLLRCLCLLGSAAVVWTQSVNLPDLYLFREVPFANDSPKGGAVEGQLYQLRLGHAVPVSANQDVPDFADYVIADTEQRLLVIGGSHLMPCAFLVMSMDKPGTYRKFELNVPERFVARTHLVAMRGRSPILLMSLFNEDAGTAAKPINELLRALDTGTDQWTNATAEMYQEVRITGGTKGFRSSDDWMGLKRFEGGRLVLPIAQHIFDFGSPLPPPLQFSSREPYLFLNNSYLALIGDGLRTADRREVIYRVLSKRRNSWSRIVVPGNASWNVRAFGPWVAGLVEDSLGVGPFRLSPGRKRRVEHAPYDTIDSYLELDRVYRPGRLFLYNSENGKYYEWNTGDGDSEIVLVEGRHVYYRIDQSIYRVAIEEKQVGKPELLIQDSVVPGIHWAFFGPARASISPGGRVGR